MKKLLNRAKRTIQQIYFVPEEARVMIENNTTALKHLPRGRVLVPGAMRTVDLSLIFPKVPTGAEFTEAVRGAGHREVGVFSGCWEAGLGATAQIVTYDRGVILVVELSVTGDSELGWA